MRSIFSAGLLDGFLQNQFTPFDINIGVSAGAYNLLCYLSGKQNISRHIFEHFACSQDFISLRRFLCGGHLIDLDWIDQVAFDPSLLDIHRAYQNSSALYVCLTDVLSGEAAYIKTQPDNIRKVIKATAALPMLYRSFPEINQRPMADGGVADGIPIAEAIRLGARKIMVVRSRHRTYRKNDTLAHMIIRWNMRQYPALLATMKQRVHRFNDSLALIRQPPKDVEIIEICPPDDFLMGRFTVDQRQLIAGYNAGYLYADDAIRQWQ